MWCIFVSNNVVSKCFIAFSGDWSNKLFEHGNEIFYSALPNEKNADILIRIINANPLNTFIVD